MKHFFVTLIILIGLFLSGCGDSSTPRSPQETTVIQQSSPDTKIDNLTSAETTVAITKEVETQAPETNNAKIEVKKTVKTAPKKTQNSTTTSTKPNEKKPENIVKTVPPEPKQLYNNGLYYGEAEGLNGNTKVEVQIVNGQISDITVLEHTDSEDLANQVFTLLKEQVIASQDTQIDTISGATKSSNGYLNAVNAALTQSK